MGRSFRAIRAGGTFPTKVRPQFCNCKDCNAIEGPDKDANVGSSWDMACVITVNSITSAKSGRIRAKRVLVSIALLFSQQSQGAEARIALVIGNSHYEELGTLRNAKADAVSIAEAFEGLG